MDSHGHIKILPDSTGKRIPQTVMTEVDYSAGTIAFSVGDIVTGLASGMVGTVLKISGNTAAGELHLSVVDPVPVNPFFTAGEALQVSSVTRALATNAGSPYYFQQMNITGGSNPNNIMEVDEEGSAQVTFESGAPNFDAFGKMKVSQEAIVAEYIHQYGIDTDKVSINLVGGGTATHLPLSSGVLLAVGTASGDKAEMVSHQYHPYRLGQSRLIEFTNAAGDTGKANLKRIFGYGDDDDGCFFAQVGTAMFARIRSSVSGSVVTTDVPQSEWNVDRLDGSRGLYNKSGKTVNPTTDTISWMDMQYLGAGTVRFGFVIDGKRIICHKWHHSNTIANPYMRTATLPVYAEIANDGVTGSSSEFRVWCTVVKNEGDIEAPSKDYSHIPTALAVTSTALQVLTNIRATAAINSITNRKSSYISSIDIVSVSAPVIIEVWKNSTLVTPTWAVARDVNTALDFDEAATVSAYGRRMFSCQVDQQGVREIDLTKVFNSRDDGIRRHFNPANYDTYTITARRVTGTGSTVVSATINWDEV
jgi:hypothetical protein